ncbi:MAG: hypothetical protein IJ362_04170 [Oscillospiraceae bacterium]|nr:hypothetical protein [Oscillospiraceae bacterium]
MVNAFVAFALVLMFAFALYALADIRPSLTPLVSVATLVNITLLMALFNMLRAGAITAYLLAAAAFAFAVYKNKDSITEKLTAFLTPGVALFAAGCVAMLVYLSQAQPMMHEWDEFSFWGISQLLVKNHNRLYTYYKSSMLGQSIPPALPVLSYFFQWANPAFTEWLGYFAYDVLFFAAFAAFTAPFEKKNWNSAVLVYLIAFFTPFFFAVSEFAPYLKPVYISAYADIPLALVTAGTVAVYFFSEKDDSRRIIPVLSLLMFLTFSKDMGLALSCIALFVIFFDLLVGKEQFTFLKIKGFMGKCAAAFAMLAVTGGSFVGWSIHLGRVLAVDRADYGGEAGMGMVEILLTGVKEFLVGPKSEKFLIIQDSFFTAFSGKKVSMAGSGRNVFIIIVAIFLLAVVFGDKKGRKRSATMFVTSTIGFVGYYLFHLLLYVYVLSGEAYDLVSYERYMYVYYIPWLAMAVMALSLAARDGFVPLAKGALLGITACMLLLFNFYILPENIFTGVNSDSFALRRSIAAKADFIRDSIGEEDVIYLYSGQDDGHRWFTYTFELADNRIIPNSGFTSAGETLRQTKTLQQQEMYDRFVKYGVTHVLIDWSSAEFIEYFDELFDVPMGHIGSVDVAYYRVNYTDSRLSFELVKGGSVTYD